jgi:alpha-L-rhamnosidase
MINILRQSEWLGGKGNCFCRKSFDLIQSPQSAKVYIAADPHTYNGNGSWMLENSFLKYRLFLNGKQFAAGPFRPVENDTPVLHEYDITKLMKTGNNVFGVISRGNLKGVALVLEIKQADGKNLLIRSDGQWKQLNDNAVFNHCVMDISCRYGDGKNGPGDYHEHIDGGKYPSGWLNPEYDDSNWMPADTYGKCPEKLELYNGPNYELKSVYPEKIKKIAAGHFFIDFGHELIGGIELDAPKTPGRVEIRLGEELDSPSCVKYKMRTGNCYQNVWTFSENNDYLTNFGIHAFRYAEIIGWNGDLKQENIRAVTVGMPFREDDSTFLSSNPKLEKVWNFCKNTIKYTTMDVYQDCPSRERIAYEADTYINMLSHFAVEGNTATAGRTFEYQLQHPTWPCEWRQFMIPVAYEYLMHTGDYELIDRHFDFLRNNCSFHNLITDGLIKEFPMRIIIDWPEYYRDGYEIGNNCAVPNAFACYDLVLLAKLSRLLNRNDGDLYLELAEQMKKTFNRCLYDDEQKLYRDGSESSHCSFHANMFALCFGLVPEERVENCLNYIEQKGMICSVYAAQFYLETLFKYGKAETAVKLMTSDDLYCSWLGMIRQGATATMEAWHPDHKPNLSWAHPWATAPANIISRYLFGLRPTLPGWKNYEYKPNPGGLEFGRLTIPTPKGKLTAEFNKKRNSYDCSVDFQS